MERGDDYGRRKYIYDNTTNGGTAGNINQRVQDLLVAMGRPSGSLARYGVEFYTALVTAGPNATTGSSGLDGTTRYLQMTNVSRALFIADGWSTAVMWVRAETGSLHFMPAGFRRQITGYGLTANPYYRGRY